MPTLPKAKPSVKHQDRVAITARLAAEQQLEICDELIRTHDPRLVKAADRLRLVAAALADYSPREGRPVSKGTLRAHERELPQQPQLFQEAQ